MTKNDLQFPISLDNTQMLPPRQPLGQTAQWQSRRESQKAYKSKASFIVKGHGIGGVGNSYENGSYLSSEIVRVDNENSSNQDGEEIIRVLDDEGDEAYNSQVKRVE